MEVKSSAYGQMTSSGCSQDLKSVLYGKPEDMKAHEALRDPSPGSQRGTQKGGSKSRGTRANIRH